MIKTTRVFILALLLATSVAAQTPNHLDIVQAVTNAHADLLAQMRTLAAEGNAQGWPQAIQDQHAATRGQLLQFIVPALAQVDPNFGYLKKTSGALTLLPTGQPVAMQITVYRPTMALVQVLSDTDPEWAPLDMTDPNNARTTDFWIAPPASGPPPTPAPQPTPAPTPTPSPAPTPPPAPAPNPDTDRIIAAINAARDAEVAAINGVKSALTDAIAQYLPQLLALLGIKK